MKIIIIHLKIGDTTMKQFKVYQLPVEHAAKFMRLSFVKEHNIMPKLEDYKLVYEGELDDDNQVSEIYDLDTIYERFQGVKPEGYKGTSISVSDVVFIYGKYFYCDSCGWEEVVFFKKGDYITKKTKAPYPSIQTLRIEEVIGRRAETTTSIAGGCTVDNLNNYRLATEDEIKAFVETEQKAYLSKNRIHFNVEDVPQEEIDLEENGNRCAGETPEMKARIAEARRMKRYQELVNKHPGAMLLFRCGDFYETYYGDAITAAKVLGITLTHRQGFEKGHEIAGFPHHALDIYLPKLIRVGLRVAIVDE